MHVFRAMLLLCLNLFFRMLLASASILDRALESGPNARQIERALSSKVSQGARVYLPDSVGYANATTRWSAAEHPDFAVVVAPATSEDVAATVRMANILRIPFLAVNRGHGSTVDLNKCHRGINIHIQSLDSIALSEDRQSATLGGGVYTDQVIRALAPNGKSAATGACTCVGSLGPGLGGGFGRYQGFYGLIADNFLELTVVTANGSIVTANEHQNPDLFWAMRGAGHNFGIVTKFKHRIYDAPTSDWWIASYQFTREKMDQVFEVLSQLNANGTQPKELTTYTIFAFDRAVSDENFCIILTASTPFILVTIYYTGSATAAQPYAQPFVDLRPSLLNNQTVSYPDLADAVGTGTSSLVCQPGNSAASFPVGLLHFNITAIHQVYDIYSDLITHHPGFSQSVVQFEAYPMQKIQSVDPASTAYAHREDNLLVSLSALYTPSTANDAIAPQYGRQVRDAFHAGQPDRQLNTYVNYAYGDETVEQMYGYEPWRLEKLRRLKKEWDPHGRFGFYHPIH